jgi:dTDP-4-dehydrorhamnose 3,5-epimerase
MPFIPTPLAGLLIFEPKVFEDSRGYFFESYNARNFQDEGLSYTFVQDNESSSSYGVIRGLHYQLQPYAQTKLVRVLHGSILDVAVDIRHGSSTFGQHFSIELNAGNRKQLLVPAGFAHGFSVLSERAVVMYKCDQYYNKESEGGIRFDDPDLAINWQIEEGREIISEKDKVLPYFSQCRSNF